MSRIFIFIAVILSLQTSFAFENFQDGDVGEEEYVETTFKPRRQIATIVYMGLAGAVLGLSTLSFYGRPQDRLSNIAVGFGAGVMVGAVYMTYKAATDPAQLYESDYDMEEARLRQQTREYLGAVSPPVHWSYRWEF